MVSSKRPPKDLIDPEILEIWHAAHRDFVIEGHDRAVFVDYCRCRQRAARMRAQVEADGATSTGVRGQIIAHPLIAVAQAEERLALKYGRELGLTLSDGGEYRQSTPAPARPALKLGGA